MKIITQRQITELHIPPKDCIDWVKNSFAVKSESILPAKTSLHPKDIDFFTTMPCILFAKNRFGVKVVHRISGAVPSLGSDLMLYNLSNGELLAIMDANWITAMRTGAVATLAAQTFRHSGHITYGFMGLGNTARASMLCLLESEPEQMHNVVLLRYKNQETDFIKRFEGYSNVYFSVCDNVHELIHKSDVLFSCITEAKSIICDDDKEYPKGCLLIPIHTRGFQNCDLSFDKVFADDTEHVKGFRYFNQFKRYAEIQDVLSGKAKGRENDTERIISYNVGLGLHDVFFASNIYDMLQKSSMNVPFGKETDKFWI